VQVRTGAKLTKTRSLIDLSNCTNQKQPTSQQQTSPLEILDLDKDEIIHFQPEREQTSTPYPDEILHTFSDECVINKRNITNKILYNFTQANE